MQKKKDNLKYHKDFSQRDRKIKILLVEDDPLARMLCSYFLQSLDCEFSVAETGTEALKKHHHSNFDLILLDINLPGISGIEVCREIRKIKTKSEIPVIFLTAYSSENIKQEAASVGGNDFYTKPITQEKLFQIINKWICKNENFSNR